MSTDARAEALYALTQFLVADTTLGDTLQQVTEITMRAMPAAAIAGITTLSGAGRPSTNVFTDEESPQIDAAQYESGNGPCLDALREQRIVRIDDMELASDQYPEFSKAARSHGVHSTLSLPMVAGGDGVGALNLYARTTNGFTGEDEAIGLDLATAAAALMANSEAYWGATQLSEQLSEAMKSRAIIEQAKGMLMAQSRDLTPDDAFEVLRKASQRENVKLREIAQRLVDRRPMVGRSEG